MLVPRLILAKISRLAGFHTYRAGRDREGCQAWNPYVRRDRDKSVAVGEASATRSHQPRSGAADRAHLEGAILAVHRTMHSLKSLSLLLASALIALTEAGCPGSCNCPNSTQYVSFPAALDVQLTATGEACTAAPYCVEEGDGGGCTEYDLYFTNAGNCHLTATAADGRQVSLDVTAHVLYKDTCCGTAYDTDSTPLKLSFDQDASTGSGG